VEKKNEYEHYIYNVKSTVQDEKIKEKLSEEDREVVLNSCKEHQQWLDSHGNDGASAEEYEGRLKELEKVWQPIISKVNQAQGGAQNGTYMGADKGGMNFEQPAGPNADDLD